MKLYLKLLVQHGIHHIHSEYTGQWDRKVYATYTVTLQVIWQRWGYINFLQRWEWGILNNILTWHKAIMSVRLYYQIIVLPCLLSRPPLWLESSAWTFTGVLESLNREFMTKDSTEGWPCTPAEGTHALRLSLAFCRGKCLFLFYAGLPQGYCFSQSCSVGYLKMN